LKRPGIRSLRESTDDTRPTAERSAAVNYSDDCYGGLEVLAMPGSGCQAVMFPAR